MIILKILRAIHFHEMMKDFYPDPRSRGITAAMYWLMFGVPIVLALMAFVHPYCYSLFYPLILLTIHGYNNAYRKAKKRWEEKHGRPYDPWTD